MPLAFESLSHGTVAFGFFNIESDLLLLDRTFFFAADFCSLIITMAAGDSESCLLKPAWLIEPPAAIGDLMGAIEGTRYTGFIGEVYQRFPFPEEPSGFIQKPGGWKTRPILLEPIGDYRFSRPGFHELLDYVWRGGYPRWENGVRPDYVRHMMQAAQESSSAIFAGAVFRHEIEASFERFR
ncbi:MAG: hypothetical protein MUC33_24000 [Desulfobacterales bacterium]|nr:hypothetical protein [Desulfobacterales bacterium]